MEVSPAIAVIGARCEFLLNNLPKGFSLGLDGENYNMAVRCAKVQALAHFLGARCILGVYANKLWHAWLRASDGSIIDVHRNGGSFVLLKGEVAGVDNRDVFGQYQERDPDTGIGFYEAIHSPEFWRAVKRLRHEFQVIRDNAICGDLLAPPECGW